MSNLSQFFAALRPYLLRHQDFDQTLRPLGLQSDERVSVYRRFVDAHEEDVLARAYPATVRALAPATFLALRQEYFLAHPLFDWEFNGNGRHFPAFLAERLAAGDARVPAFLPELADLEWTDLSVYYDEAVIPTGGPLALNPTAALRSYRHEVVAFWEDEEATTLPGPRENLLLIYRHPETDRCRWFEPEPKELLVLKTLTEEVPVEEAAAQAGLPESQLRAWLAEAAGAGWVVGTRG